MSTDPIFETDFVKEMARQMRALDTYGTYQGWTVEKILDPYVLTKERKANDRRPGRRDHLARQGLLQRPSPCSSKRNASCWPCRWCT